MASFLPRGVSSPKGVSSAAEEALGDLPSPSEDLNTTVTKLLDTNARLLDKIAELEGDKKHFQNKLEEYICYDREEGSNDRTTISQLERRISELLAEKADLQARLLKKNKDNDDLYTSQELRLLERDHRAHLLQRLNELQASLALGQQKHAREMELLKLENLGLQEEVGRLRKILNMAESRRDRPPSWELVRPYQRLYSSAEGYSSLPESLPSFSSSGGATGQHRNTTESITGHHKGSEIPNIAALRLTSNPAPPSDSTAASVAVTELKKIKKQLDKYKTANIELDQKLKDAKLELRKYEERGSEVDVGYRMDLERFRSENNQLRAQLDRALSESNHLRSLLGSRRY